MKSPVKTFGRQKLNEISTWFSLSNIGPFPLPGKNVLGFLLNNMFSSRGKKFFDPPQPEEKVHGNFVKFFDIFRNLLISYVKLCKLRKSSEIK